MRLHPSVLLAYPVAKIRKYEHIWIVQELPTDDSRHKITLLKSWCYFSFTYVQSSLFDRHHQHFITRFKHFAPSPNSLFVHSNNTKVDQTTLELSWLACSVANTLDSHHCCPGSISSVGRRVGLFSSYYCRQLTPTPHHFHSSSCKLSY